MWIVGVCLMLKTLYLYASASAWKFTAVLSTANWDEGTIPLTLNCCVVEQPPCILYPTSDKWETMRPMLGIYFWDVFILLQHDLGHRDNLTTAE
jgi:hypothetical protein